MWPVPAPTAAFLTVSANTRSFPSSIHTGSEGTASRKSRNRFEWSPFSGARKRLAGEPAGHKVEVRQVTRCDLRDVPEVAPARVRPVVDPAGALLDLGVPDARRTELLEPDVQDTAPRKRGEISHHRASTARTVSS